MHHAIWSLWHLYCSKNISADFKQAETKYIVFTGSVLQKYISLLLYIFPHLWVICLIHWIILFVNKWSMFCNPAILTPVSSSQNVVDEINQYRAYFRCNFFVWMDVNGFFCLVQFRALLLLEITQRWKTVRCLWGCNCCDTSFLVFNYCDFS